MSEEQAPKRRGRPRRAEGEGYPVLLSPQRVTEAQKAKFRMLGAGWLRDMIDKAKIPASQKPPRGGEQGD